MVYDEYQHMSAIKIPDKFMDSLTKHGGRLSIASTPRDPSKRNWLQEELMSDHIGTPTDDGEFRSVFRDPKVVNLGLHDIDKVQEGEHIQEIPVKKPPTGKEIDVQETGFSKD